MTRAEFAKPIAREVGVDFITILTALSILASTLPQFMALCRDDDEVPMGFRIKQACMNQPVITRWEIMKLMPDVKPRHHRKRVAETIRLKIIATTPEDIMAMLAENDVHSSSV